MEGTLAAALGILLAIAATGLLSRRTGLPAPVLLTAEGIVWALLPTPNLQIDPQLVLTFILPPLLYSAALDSSLTAVRDNRRWILLLAVGLVVGTTFAVGGVAYALIPGVSFATACVLGAVVGPNDAIAANAVGRTVPMPERLQHIFEGESLLNDATALTVYSVAVDAVVHGGFSLPGAVGQFLLAGGGGAALGFLVAVVLQEVKSRIEEPLAESVLSLATPFLAYLPAEEAHTSGVVAVVVAGLWLGHRSPRLQSGGTRLQVNAVWRLVTFVLEGLVFLLIGLDLAHIIAGLEPYRAWTLAGWSAAVLAVVIIVRPAFIFPVVLRSRLGRSDAAGDGWRAPTALSWVGMRGVVTLAAAEGIPLTRADGSPFPQRNLILLLSFVTVIGTLVLQGLTLGGLLRRLGLGRDVGGMLEQRASAVEASLAAGLRSLDDQLVDAPDTDPEVVDQLRRNAESRRAAAWARVERFRRTERAAALSDGGGAEAGGGGARGDGNEPPREPTAAATRRLRLAMLRGEREELVRQRDAGRLSDAMLRDLQVSLDLEERALERRGGRPGGH